MKWWGVLGLVMVVVAEFSLFFDFEPLQSYYFAIAWFGFIFLIDSFVEKLTRKSLLKNNKKKFFLLLFLSALFWWIFEIINLGVVNWDYTHGRLPVDFWHGLKRTIYFATVLPAIFEVSELFKVMHRFDRFKLKHKHKITKWTLYAMIFSGIVTLLLTLIWPNYFYPLVWVCFFFLLDPINYMNKVPSLIKHLEDRKVGIILALAAAGLVCGILWEYWNFWAAGKWTYSIPYVGFLKIFEMPLLGYLGYIPFAFELYAMYHFFKYYISKLDKKKRMESMLKHHK